MYLAQSLATVRLDPASRIPMFRQLYDVIKQSILDGTLSPGTQLPPTRELSQLFRISRQTVLNAYAQLTAEGFLSGTVGKGTFVSASLPLSATVRRAVSEDAPPPMLRPLSRRGQRFVGEATRLNVHQGMPRAFRIGMPGLDVFPFDVWARLEARRWRRPGHHLGYDDPAGYRPLRDALAVYLRASRGVHCSAEQIIITSGSQQALFLLASMLLAPNDAAWVEEPGYRGINASLLAAEARICPVPVDDEGLCVPFGVQHYPDAKLAYVTPSHQLPLGVTMSLPRRLALLRWAAENKAWIVEDDYDSEYRYTGPPLASLQSLDKTGCVIYVGTLSKLLFPGLRLGYLVVPPALADAVTQGKAVIDRHTSTMPQLVLTDFISEGHFSRHIKRTRDVYAERRAALLDALDTHLADQLCVGASDAGIQFAATFRRRRNDQAVVQAALDKGIELRALSGFYNADASASTKASGLVFGFASVPAAEIRRSVLGLRDILEE